MVEQLEQQAESMSNNGESNGDRAPFPSFPPLPETATPREVAVACANALSEMIPKFRELDEDLAETKAAALVASGAAARAEKAAKRAEDVSLRAVRAVEGLERRLDGPEIERRAQASVPALNEMMDALSKRIVAEVRSPIGGEGNISERRVVELLENAFKGRDLASFEKGRDFRRSVLQGVLIAVVASAVSGAAALAIGESHGRNSAPQATQPK